MSRILLTIAASLAFGYTTPFDIREAQREGGGLVDIIGLIGLALLFYLAGLAASFPMYLVKFRKRFSERGFLTKCLSISLANAGSLTQVALEAYVLSILVSIIPLAIIFGAANFLLFEGGLRVEFWLFGYLALVVGTSFVVALRQQWRKSGDAMFDCARSDR